MINLLNNIRFCEKCSLSLLRMNRYDKLLGYGKLNPFYKGNYTNKIMLVGLSPSHRRYPGIHRAFGGDVPHKGTGYEFTKLLTNLGLINKVYITNLIKCSHESNKPQKISYDRCFPVLRQEINMVQPPKIIALGDKVYGYLKEKLFLKELNMLHKLPCPVATTMLREKYSKLLCQQIKTNNH